MGKLIIGSIPTAILWGNDNVDHVFIGDEHVWPWSDGDVMVNIYIDGVLKDMIPMTLSNNGITDTNWGFYIKHELKTSGTYNGKYFSNITYYNNEIVQYECKHWTSTADIQGPREGDGEGLYGVFSKDDTNQVWNIYLVTDGLITVNVYVDEVKKQTFKIPMGNSNWRDESNYITVPYSTDYGCKLVTSRYVIHEYYYNDYGEYKDGWYQHFRARFAYNTSGTLSYTFDRMTYGANNLAYKTITDITSFEQLHISMREGTTVRYWGYYDDFQINIYLHSPRVKVTVYTSGRLTGSLSIPYTSNSQTYKIGNVSFDVLAAGSGLARSLTGVYNEAGNSFVTFNKMVTRSTNSGESTSYTAGTNWNFRADNDPDAEVEYYVDLKTIEYKTSVNNGSWKTLNSVFTTTGGGFSDTRGITYRQTLNTNGSMTIKFMEDNGSIIKKATFYNGDTEVFSTSGAFTHTFTAAEMNDNLRAEFIIEEPDNKIQTELLLNTGLVQSVGLPVPQGSTDVRIFHDYPGFEIQMTHTPQNALMITAVNELIWPGYKVYAISVTKNGQLIEVDWPYEPEKVTVSFDVSDWQDAKIHIYMTER